MARLKQRSSRSSRTSIPRDADSWIGFLCAALLVVAFVFGGASRQHEIRLALVELAAIPLLLLAIARLARQPLGNKWIPVALLAAVMILPLLQLIPLPPEIWTRLPRREGVVQVLDGVGAKLPWLPLSLTPGATLHDWLALLPPAAMFLGAATLDQQKRKRLALVLLGLVFVSVVFGLLQIAGGSGSVLRLYETSHLSRGVGLFANRNHQAILLVSAIPFVAAAAIEYSLTLRQRPLIPVTIALAVLLVLAIGIAVAGSRAGIILFVPAVVGGLMMAVRGDSLGRRRRNVVLAAAAVLVVSAAAGGLGLSSILSGFDPQGEPELRFEAAPVIAAEAARHLPLGSGIGAFDPIYRSLESPETMTGSYLNHAHNDYLELWLETGVVGALLLVGFLVWYGMGCWDIWRARSSSPRTNLARAGSIVILLILVHSTVDYPLRTPALATLFAMVCAMLVLPPASERGGSRIRRRTEAPDGG